MIKEYIVENLLVKWEGAKMAIYSNTIQITTIAYVCYLVYFAMCLYYKREKEEEYPRAFAVTAGYVVARMFGALVMGVR